MKTPFRELRISPNFKTSSKLPKLDEKAKEELMKKAQEVLKNYPGVQFKGTFVDENVLNPSFQKGLMLGKDSFKLKLTKCLTKTYAYIIRI